MREEKLKIVVYFGKEKDPIDPFGKFGIKRKVYYELFDCGIEAGLDMYISSGRPAYLGGRCFGNLLRYENGAFAKHQGTVEADAIYDRSGGLAFPSDEISPKVLDCAAFKRLCYDKNKLYEILGDLMPKSIRISATDKLLAALSEFNPDQMAVLKPASDFGGKGIYIDYPRNLEKIGIEREHVLQEFVDTSKGIPGITDRHHDLRIVIVEGEIVLAHVRTPKDGSLLANVAQGGNIKEIELEKILGYILSTVHEVQAIIDSKYNMPLYSIDFGISNGKAYVFELNDQIGFPSEHMENRTKFVFNIIKSLKRLAEQKFQ